MNGEVKKYTTSSTGGHSMVRAVYRIIERYAHLHDITDEDTPLAIYCCSVTGKAKYIASDDIETAMYSLASHTYGITEAKELKKWSAHSLRVGACNIRQAMGFSDRQVQFLLRWRSNSFTAYLRNVGSLCNMQNDAIQQILDGEQEYI